MTLSLTVREESWPLKKPFKITRETITHSEIVYCEISDGTHVGRGEAAGIPYKGETPARIAADIEAVRAEIEGGMDRDSLQSLMKVGGARNALDCALWDLEAKRAGKTIWQLLGQKPAPTKTVYTVSMDTPGNMRADAAAHAGFQAIKVKVGIGDPLEQVANVRAGAPDAAIIIDANQGWGIDELSAFAPGLAKLGVAMIEQPLPADDDGALAGYTPAVSNAVPICADESCQVTADLDRLSGLYQMINIKLDKAGGLTEALKLADRAAAMGFEVMVGNMLGTSLAMAPAFVIAQACKYVDIDGPLLQSEDRDHAMIYHDDGTVEGPTSRLWG